MKDFIREFPNAATKKLCKKILTYLESEEMSDFSIKVKDEKITTYQETVLLSSKESELDSEISEMLSKHLSAYFSDRPEFHFSQNVYEIVDTGYYLQKWKEGEDSSEQQIDVLQYGKPENRVLSVVLYLNDLERGGETEFIEHGERIIPRTGKLLIYPSTIGFSHRENIPLGVDKYTLTTYIIFTPKKK